MKRNIGVLLPISSLYSNHGIGDFGKDTYHFIDFLHNHHFKYWQILPLNPVGGYNSPYMSICSLAIDYRYISLDMLEDEGYLDNVPNYRKNAKFVDYYKVGEFKKKYLYKAYLSYLNGPINGLKKFKTNNPWVIQYATYEVFKKINNNQSWDKWPIYYKNYFLSHECAPIKYLKEIDFVIFCQYIAFKQYHHLLAYLKKKKIKLIADVPFYVGFDSSDCWINKKQFAIKNDKSTLIAGVPPDAFSETGQLWGNPIYDFNKMKMDSYSFLVNRIGQLAKRCDYLRLDHFRAFDTYFAIPNGELTAENGKWEIGPREDFFNALYHFYPNINLIAEDLGDLFPSVIDLRDKLNLPGMYVVQFNIFDKNNKSNKNLIVYPGTHDNDTLLGWFKSLDNKQIKYLKKRFKTTKKKILFEKIFKYILSLESKMTIIPLQDLLGLSSEARINTPGTTKKENWTFRLSSKSCLDNIRKI